LIVDAVRIAWLGGTVTSVIVALFGLPALGISILFGTLLGTANFMLLARGVGAAIDRTVEEIERTRREAGRELDPTEVARRGAGGAMRLAMVVLLVAAVLWYPSTEPLGLAIGVIIMLIALSLAALRENGRENRQRTSQNAS
jgi:Na+/H+ antiporter NhaD/arsenite permease-like protein